MHGELEKSTVKMGSFKPPLSSLDKFSRQNKKGHRGI